jgi:zinc protease
LLNTPQRCHYRIQSTGNTYKIFSGSNLLKPSTNTAINPFTTAETESPTGGQTRSDATVSFIQAMQTEIERLKTELVTPEELALAKDSVLNSFVFNFEDPAQTLTRLLRYEYYGYPADFLFRYRQAVEATTAEDIQRVAQIHLKPENLVTLVVGNAAAIQPPLTALASEVTPIDITIPEAEPVATQQKR